MKKILFFALALVAGVMSMNAQTALDTTQVDGIWYILDKTNHTSTVTFRPSDTDPNMVAEENYMGRLISRPSSPSITKRPITTTSTPLPLSVTVLSPKAPI